MLFRSQVDERRRGRGFERDMFRDRHGVGRGNGDEFRVRWTLHISNNDSALHAIGEEFGLMADRAAAIHVAEWCYSEAYRVGAEVWLGGGRYERLERGSRSR